MVSVFSETFSEPFLDTAPFGSQQRTKPVCKQVLFIMSPGRRTNNPRLLQGPEVICRSITPIPAIPRVLSQHAADDNQEGRPPTLSSFLPLSSA